MRRWWWFIYVLLKFTIWTRVIGVIKTTCWSNLWSRKNCSLIWIARHLFVIRIFVLTFISWNTCNRSSWLSTKLTVRLYTFCPRYAATENRTLNAINNVWCTFSSVHRVYNKNDKLYVLVFIITNSVLWYARNRLIWFISGSLVNRSVGLFIRVFKILSLSTKHLPFKWKFIRR